MHKVSVILPTHNRAELLPVAIASVLNQTFQDFEILVVDDASKDTTHDIATRLSPARIRYLRHDVNRGGSAARNTGIANSNAPYVAFLDDDDEWLPEKLARQVNVLDNSPLDVGGVYTGYLQVDRVSGQIFERKIPTRRDDYLRALLQSNYIGNTSGVLLRKECFKKAGLFDESQPSFEDYDLWLRISREYQFACIEQPLFKYYTHQSRNSTNAHAMSIGIEMMLKKYGHSYFLRKNLSYYSLAVGALYCDIGDMKKSEAGLLESDKITSF